MISSIVIWSIIFSFFSVVWTSAISANPSTSSNKTKLFCCKNTKLSCLVFIITLDLLFSPSKVTSITTFSLVSNGSILIGVASIYSSDFLTCSSVNPSNKVNPSSDLPPTRPIATAIFNPNLSVPGIPTHIAFLYTFGLTSILFFTTSSPNNSFAFAQASATATGSVHPTAGLTSAFSMSIKFSLKSLIF